MMEKIGKIMQPDLNDYYLAWDMQNHDLQLRCATPMKHKLFVLMSIFLDGENKNKLLEKRYGFIKHSLKYKTPPVEMRWKMWDKIQGKNSPRYWSWVLEENPKKMDKIYKHNYTPTSYNG